MRIHYLVIFLIYGIFLGEGQAMSPRQGGATGGAAAATDISKCDLNPSQQTKVKVKGKDGKDHFVCTGQAVCGGKSIPVSCKVSERELCPIATKCIRFLDDDPSLNLPLKFIIERPQSSLKYWTVEKIKNASPMPLPLLKGNPLRASFVNKLKKILVEPSNINEFKGGDFESGKGILISSTTFKENSFFNPTGKLFSTSRIGRGSRDTFCSASVTNVGGKIVLITAAHCVVTRGMSGNWDEIINKNIHFVQNYGYSGSEKEAVAKSIIIPQGFMLGSLGENEDSFRYDIALIEIESNSDLNCCYGLSTGHLTPPGISLGYPIEGRFGQARFMFFVKIDRMLSEENLIKNDFAGGGSGGPWIGHSPSGGQYGYISGINSYKGIYDPPNTLRSPLFWYLIEDMIKCSKKEIHCDEFIVK